ncbi:MAG: TylF/MycF/NovP-related O-methyltransferase [Vicinamibacterales bacterium]
MSAEPTPATDDALWEAYNTLLLSPDVDRVRKLLVRYELFKRSLDVPGDIVECGVFKGAGLMYWAKLLAIHAPGSLKRVVGFDVFDTFASSLTPFEKENADAYLAEAGSDGLSRAAIEARVRAAGFERLVETVAGDIQATSEAYVAANPGFRISLLHLDLDTYLGTKAALERFYPLVSRGGVLVFDEYGCRNWGESDAVDEFFADKPVRVQAVPLAAKPTAFVVKP